MNELSLAPATLRLHSVDGPLIGTTAFFLYRAFLGALCRQILPSADGPTRIMARTLFIGAAAYFLPIRIMIKRPELFFQIEATGLFQGFVNYAARGVYPSAVQQGALAE